MEDKFLCELDKVFFKISPIMGVGNIVNRVGYLHVIFNQKRGGCIHYWKLLASNNEAMLNTRIYREYPKHDYHSNNNI